MAPVSEVGASQARVMNLVLVMTASRPRGAEGRLERLGRTALRPNNETGLGDVTRLESAEKK